MDLEPDDHLPLARFALDERHVVPFDCGEKFTYTRLDLTLSLSKGKIEHSIDNEQASRFDRLSMRPAGGLAGILRRGLPNWHRILRSVSGQTSQQLEFAVYQRLLFSAAPTLEAAFRGDRVGDAIE